MGLIKYKLGELIEQQDERNSTEEYTIKDVRGISTDKAFIQTKANMQDVSLTPYKVVIKNDFAYVADTSRRGDKIAIAYNNDKNIIISAIYTVFRIKRQDLLLSDYLLFISIVLSLIDMQDFIPGDLQEKLLIGMKCVILK